MKYTFPQSRKSHKFIFCLLIVFVPTFLAAGIIFSFPPSRLDTHMNSVHPYGYYPGDPLPDHMAYLTFDDGPSDWTDMVLDTLRAHNIKATFFICANWQPKSTRENNSFKKYRKTLQRMILEGHVIGNHSRSHPNFAKNNTPYIVDQLDTNQELFNRELGMLAFPMTLIRPPYGEPWFNPKDPRAMANATVAIAPRGLMILWSRHFYSGDSMNWVKGDWYEAGPRVNISSGEFKTKMTAIYNRLINSVDGGGMVILFHDTHRTTAEILDHVIDKLRDLGYNFGTVEDYVQWRWGKSSGEMIRDFRQKMMVDATGTLSSVSVYPDIRIK